MVFVYRVISMDLICFCNYVLLPWLLYVILCRSLSVLSCWDSFWLLCIKQLSSKDTRVSNILRMLVVWWATSTINCQICISCSQKSRPSESFSSPISGNCCTRPSNTPLRNSILLWYGWWLIQKLLSQYTLLSTWISLSNFHTLSTFVGIPLYTLIE